MPIPSSTASSKSRGTLEGPFSMFLHAPELAERVAHLGAYVRFEGKLDMRVRVLAAMTVARELDAVVRVGGPDGQRPPPGRAGVHHRRHPRQAHARRARRGRPDHRLHPPAPRRAPRRRRDGRRPPPALRRPRAHRADGRIGYYAMLAMTVNTCELEAAPGAEVLAPRAMRIGFHLTPFWSPTDRGATRIIDEAVRVVRGGVAHGLRLGLHRPAPRLPSHRLAAAVPDARPPRPRDRADAAQDVGAAAADPQSRRGRRERRHARPHLATGGSTWAWPSAIARRSSGRSASGARTACPSSRSRSIS